MQEFGSNIAIFTLGLLVGAFIGAFRMAFYKDKVGTPSASHNIARLTLETINHCADVVQKWNFMNIIRAIWLFFRIVWRIDSSESRMSIETAWRVSKSIWLSK